MASVIVDAFEEQVPAPDAEYVEEQLLQIMSDEFETELEDDSAVDVAKDVVRMWAETHAGDSTSVLKFETHADKFKAKKVEVEVAPAEGEEDWEDDSDEDGSDDDEHAPELMETSARPPKPEPEPLTEAPFVCLRNEALRGRPTEGTTELKVGLESEGDCE